MRADVLLLVYALATARVTGFITADGLFQGWRNAALQALVGTEAEPRAGRVREKLAYLLTCPWCVSVYVGAVAAGGWYYDGGDRPYLYVPAVALAFSQVTGMVSDLGRD